MEPAMFVLCVSPVRLSVPHRHQHVLVIRITHRLKNRICVIHERLLSQVYMLILCILYIIVEVLY